MTKTPRSRQGRLTQVDVMLLASAMGIALVGIKVGSDGRSIQFGLVMVGLGISLVGTAVIVVVLNARDRAILEQSAEIRDRVRTAEDDLSRALEQAIQTGDAEERRLDEALLLSRVWQSVTARLAQYHDDAQSQGRRAFNAAMTAMWVGFLITAGCGGVAVFLATTNTGAVVIGALGAVAAALSGYVARTHLRAYEAVSGQLQGYFSQPVEASRYLSAERAIHVSGLSEDARRELMTSLVAAMVAPPARDGVST